MKKILLSFGGGLVIFAVVFSASVALAAKPDKCATIQGGTITDTVGNTITTGYDKWGYNYQARMFNGWDDNSSRPATTVAEGDSLMMKWNDAWLSNQDCNRDGKLDRHYGFDAYKGSGAWLTNHASGTYEGMWNVVGTWKWLVLGAYEHDLIITSQDVDGNFTATGGYPAGSAPYTSIDQTPEVITNGKITGDQITFTTTYTGPYNPEYSVTVTGTINADGTITGTEPFEWKSTQGSAVKETCKWSDFVKIVAVPADAYRVGPANTGIWYTADDVEIGIDVWNEFAIIQEVSSDPCGDFDLMNYKSELRSGLGNW